LFISELHIKEFRLFNNNSFKLGRYITAIAGFNATGKSTVLGLLGHCGELKPRRYKPLLYNAFKVELGEILKFSEPYDKKIADLGRITFTDNATPGGIQYPSQLLYRGFWQKYIDGRRYRIIPKKTAEWPSSGKIEWPTLYLGLGRLYPLGESLNVAKTNLSAKLSEEDTKYIINNMKSILSIIEESKDFTIASISETAKKKGVGFNTDKYNYLSNSAGQDNLGQILMSILSFKILKTKLGNNWRGGLLVVDELDAALHPLAQNKLVDFLYHQAEEIDMQIVFTSHSLGLLECICTKTEHNSATDTNPYELISLTNANGPVEVVQNPSFDAIYKELMATYCTPTSRKISVFSEDDEARFFIKKLLERYTTRYKLLDASFGRDELLKMLTSDFVNFSQYIYILDGDVTDEDIKKHTQKVAPVQVRCILKLPGDKSPEQVIWEYLNQLTSEHRFLKWGQENGLGYTKRSFEEHGPLSGEYSGCDKEREKFKKWFNANTQLVSHVFDYWYEDNKQSAEKFVKDFITAYNWIARRCFIPIIPIEPKKEEENNCPQPHLL
jgi:AAA15 family ATPase/GTPase